MKKFIVIFSLVMAFYSNVSFAGNGAFYTEIGKFMAKSSGLCPSGNVVQSICQHGSAAVAPSNSYPYLGPGEKISNTGQKCVEMGTDPLSGYYFGDGELGSLVGESDYYLHGYVRAFSDTNILSSAYFGNSRCESINPTTGGASDNLISNNVPVGTVNPAYTIPFDSNPATGSGEGSVIGSVFATTAGANNQLESGFILLEWRFVGETTWNIGTESLIGNFGDFDFNIIVAQNTNVYVRARVKDADSPLDGFPISDEFLVAVTPTTAAPLVNITSPNGGNNYSIDIGPHSTNIVGSVDVSPDSLVWSNSLNNSGGAISLATSFDFSADLILGANQISVYASNAAGTGSDSITITVNNPPPPTVNISTGNILTNAWPVSVSGTSSDALSVLLSNSVTAATFPCTGIDSWSVNISGTDNAAQNYVAVAVNIGGDTDSAPVLIDHDNIAPTVELTSPINNFTSNSDIVTFTFTAVDDRHSVASTEIRFDGGLWQNFSSGNNHTLAEGSHTWEVRATDNVGSGNTSLPTGSRTFFVYEPPIVAFDNPISSGIYNTNGPVDMTIPVDGSVTDGSSVVLSNITTDTEYSVNIVGADWDVADVTLARGENILVVRAKRNNVDSAPSQITINNQPQDTPIVNINNPNGGGNYSIDIGPHSTNIVGTINIIPDSLVLSNSFTYFATNLIAATSFDVLVDLSIGTNLITIYATKSAVTGSDLISIIVTEPSSKAPYIDVVSPTNWSSFPAAQSINITGIATGDVVMITRNGTDITSEYTNPDWTDSRFIGLGTNSLIYVAVDSDGNSATDIVNYVVTDESSKIPPYIEVSSPSNLSVYTVPVDIPVAGIATDNFAVVTISRNGMDITAGYVAPNWSDNISAAYLSAGTNLFTYIAIDANGNSATDDVSFVVISAGTNAPVVTITAPNNGDDYSFIGNNHFTNFIGTVDVVPDSLSWFRACSDGNTNSGNIIPPTANFSNEIELLIGVNFVKFEAVKGGITGSASMVVTVTEEVPVVVARVLETWPRYIGESQSGTVEFISSKSASWKLNVVNDPAGTQMVANGFCTTGWNLVHFYGSDLPVLGDVDDFSNLFELVIGDELGDDNKDVLQAYSSSIVDDLKTDGAPFADFDNDSIYVKYITKSAGKCEAKGRTLFITDGSHDDKLTVKVKPTLGSDGVADICGVFSDSGLKKVQVMGDLDSLQLDGVLGTLILKGGSLGRPNGSLRYNVRFNALTTKSKSKIMVKAGKNKSSKIVIPANVNANILAGELEAEPNNVKDVAGLKLLKIIGGNLGVEFDDKSKITSRHWLNAKYTDIIMVKPKSGIYGGKTFDYSFYFSGESFPAKGSFKKMYLYYGLDDSSDNNQDNATIVCGYDDLINPVQITGFSWTNEVAKYSFGKIITKLPAELQGTVAIKNWLPNKGKLKQVKGQEDARWIVDGKEE